MTPEKYRLFVRNAALDVASAWNGPPAEFEKCIRIFEELIDATHSRQRRDRKPDAEPGLEAAFKQIKANGEVLNDVCIKAQANTTKLAGLERKVGENTDRLLTQHSRLNSHTNRFDNLGTRLCDVESQLRLALSRAESFAPAPEPATKPSTEEEAALDEIFATLDNLLLEEKFSECRQWLHDADTDKMSLPELMVAMTATHNAIPQLMPDYEQFFWAAYNSAKNRGLDAGQMVGFAPRLADWPVPPPPKPACEHMRVGSEFYWAKGKRVGIITCSVPQCEAVRLGGDTEHFVSTWYIPEPASEEGADGAAKEPA